MQQSGAVRPLSLIKAGWFAACVSAYGARIGVYTAIEFMDCRRKLGRVFYWNANPDAGTAIGQVHAIQVATVRLGDAAHHNQSQPG